MTTRYWGEIKDPVHGYVYITEAEKAIIDSYPMQRLHRIKQLAGAEFVYPGANHTRFEHSIGVMYLAGRLTENSAVSDHMSDGEAEMVRIAALLHDVGHGPFSHVFEHLLDKFLGKTHEDYTTWVIQESELKDVLNKYGYNSDSIGKLAVGRLNKPGKPFLDQVVRSAVDVDKLDFILRDTYHTGAAYGYVDIFRLIHMLDVLDGNLTINIGALSALESFILARIESFKSIYFHRVGRAAQIMIALAMEEAKDELGLVDFETPEDYLAMNDYVVWTMLKNCEKSKEIIHNLEKRKLLKCTYSKTFYVKDETISSLFSVEEIRSQMREKIASKAEIDPQLVVIDVPTVPSVPYRHSTLMEPMEIPVFQRTRDGKKIPNRLSEVSGIFDVLKGFINILRVYTDVKHRDKVEAASAHILGSTPSSTKISF